MLEQALILGAWKLMTLAKAETWFYISLACDIEQLELSDISILILL